MGLINNVSLLLSIVFVLDLFIVRLRKSKTLLSEIFVGVILALIVLALMNTSWEMSPGVIFDTRSILLGVSGMFFGLIPTTIASLVAIAYRIYLGGSGMYMGISVILESAIIGLIWGRIRKEQLNKISIVELIAFGLLIHLIMVALMLALPGSIKGEAFYRMFPLLVTIYPLGTILLGVIMSRRYNQDTSEKELIESKNSYKFLFDNMSQGVVIQNKNGEILEANKAATKILGISPDNILGKRTDDPIWQVVSEKGNLLGQDEIPSNLVLKTGKPILNTVIGVHNPKTNEYRWILTGSIPRIVGDEENSIVTMTSFVDITDRIVAERKLKESQDSYRNLFTNMQSGFVYHKIILNNQRQPIDYEFIEVNNHYEEMTGLKREKIIGKRITEIVPNIREESYDWIGAYGKVAMGEGPLKTEQFFEPFKKWFSVQAYSPKPGYFAVIFSDITQRKTDEENLKKLNFGIMSEKYKLEAILRDMGDAVFVTDSNKTIYFANRAIEELFGVREADMLGKNIEEIMNLHYENSGDKPLDLISNVFDEKKAGRAKEKMVLSKNPEELVYVDGVGTPIIDENNQIISTVWVFHDVTKEREVDKMKSDFISLASHQLRTPLTGIRWFIEILQQSLSKIAPEKVREYIDKIGISNRRMIELVNDLLRTSKIDSGKLIKEVGSYTIKEILQQSIDGQGMIFEEKGIKIIGMDSVPADYIVDVDIIQLVQVFGNLLNNAANYSPENSSILISAEQSDSSITVAIKDQGVGIPKSQQAKMFTKFFRADNVAKTIPGSGLGLYVAKSIIENHCGKIWFESTENLGTTFFVRLPTSKNRL